VWPLVQSDLHQLVRSSSISRDLYFAIHAQKMTHAKFVVALSGNDSTAEGRDFCQGIK